MIPMSRVSRIQKLSLVIGVLAATALLYSTPADANEKRFANVMKKFDKDGDGKLSPNEWPRPPGSFRKIDKDGDGFLSKEDFLKHWASQDGGGASNSGGQGGNQGGQRRAGRNGGGRGPIPMIDAHSQVDCHMTEDMLMSRLNQMRISRVLISMRGCKGHDTSDLERRSLDWGRKHPDRISVHLSTKVDGWSFDPMPGNAGGIDAFLSRSRASGFAGMGEVLVQHAAHDHARLSYPELDLSLNEERITTAIGVARDRKWPVILHIELNDNERASKQTLQDLSALLNKYQDTQFVLIHMGQASPEEAKFLLENHKNINFLTTHADSLTAFQLKKKQKSGKTSQLGWINLFEEGCKLNQCPSAWNPQWRELVERFSDRFVLGFDNVFPQHWQKPFQIRAGIWRRALKLLPRDVAHNVAHRNAERLWNLPPAKTP